jgi:hypothetical protein
MSTIYEDAQSIIKQLRDACTNQVTGNGTAQQQSSILQGEMKQKVEGLEKDIKASDTIALYSWITKLIRKT